MSAGPVVDGSFVPDLASVLLADGHFDHSINIMAGHNSDEGLLFTSLNVTNESSYEAFVRQQFPGIPVAALTTITEALYPANFNGSFGYTDQIGRTDITIGDFSIVCNAHYLNTAFGNDSYAYQFSIPPGLHGEDLSYTFYDGGADPGVNTTLAVLMQHYILNFAVGGSPNAAGLPLFPCYDDAREENLNSTLLGPMHDDTASARCAWWQKALYR